MAPSSRSSSARRQRLGAELRKLRERTGMSARAAAELLGGTQAQISNIEAGRAGVSAERVRTLARNYSCLDAELIEALAAMTGERGSRWWEEYRGILPAGMLELAELEHHARALRVAHTVHIPGLLQTAEHARTVFRQGVPPLPPPEVEHRVSFRIKRQAILYGENPTPLEVILHEAALRMTFGGKETTREQLRHLLDVAQHDHVTIRVIPFAAGAFPGSGQSVSYASGPVPQLDTVQLDQSHGTVLIDAEAQLRKYQILLDRMRDVSLGSGDSLSLIREIEGDLTKA